MPKPGSSSITLRCSSRLQYLCSHFSTASSDTLGRPYRAHRIGTSVAPGKSQ